MANYTINKGYDSYEEQVEADDYNLDEGYFIFSLRAGNQKVLSIAANKVWTITLEDPQRPGGN